jgi:hypothetical protein
VKDVTGTKREEAFQELWIDLKESLQSTKLYASCPSTVQLFAASETKAPSEMVDDWIAAVDMTLSKGSAKYAKAVSCINNSPACVYHAIAYRDVKSCRASSALFEKFDFLQKMEDAESDVSQQERGIVWECIDELTSVALRARRRTSPTVPTPQDIAANISKRKAVKTDTEPVLSGGVTELWRGLCDRRKVSMPDDAEPPQTVLSELGWSSEKCKRPDALMADELLKHCPYLGSAPLTDEDWSDVERAIALNTMHSSIPMDMMKSIEGYAQKLMADISSGQTSLDNLDIEEIGRTVLSGSSHADLESFATNIEQIMPALSAMGAMRAL